MVELYFKPSNVSVDDDGETICKKSTWYNS